jgi:SpoVK/Ycf46/Vps4 family AAA+-type ATPase
MAEQNDTIRKLRAALVASPDNVPLREHLAETLLRYGYPAEAETEYRVAMQIEPDSLSLKMGLARSFFQQNKNSHALVVVEELLKTPAPPADAHLLYARLMLRTGDIERSVHHYQEAVRIDPQSGDPDLAEQLGIKDHLAEDEDDERDTDDLVDGRLRAAEGITDSGGPEIERPKISFADVGGMESVKEEIRVKIIYPLQRPDLYKAYGKSIGGGILLYGPPGCGKTYLARATAGEVGASFLSVGIDDVVEMWIGQSERNLHALFENARSHAPSVLFFDEVDALGAKRSDMRQSAGRQLINQFLAELDGSKSSNEGVLVLAATNAPWHLDGAFRRPGRFDRLIFVPPPDEQARAAILQIHLRGKPAEDVDCQRLAAKTKGYSGADLKALVDIAVEEKLRKAFAGGSIAPLATGDLLAAIKKHRPTTADWFSAARNYALYANADGLYDEILSYLDL